MRGSEAFTFRILYMFWLSIEVRRPGRKKLRLVPNLYYYGCKFKIEASRKKIFSSLNVHYIVSLFKGMRILVMLLLDTLPMLGNVLLLCFFVFFIFGIIGVQLWAGVLRNRCFINISADINYQE